MLDPRTRATPTTHVRVPRLACALFALVLALAWGCVGAPEIDDTTRRTGALQEGCVPSCAERVCGPDGCGGECGPPTGCQDTNACTTGVCNDDGQCEQVPIAGPCDDGDPCTLDDACDGGACWPGPLVDCDDGNPCTFGACQGAEGCQQWPKPGPCDDGDPCTLASHCDDGDCLATLYVPCDDGDPCTLGACSPDSGDCHQSPADGPCDDGDVCTEADHCQAGACVGGVAIVCDDGEPCTLDGCDPFTGCWHELHASVCDDGNPCTYDTCNLDMGCVNTPVELKCDDGDACTHPGICQQGYCVTTPVDCDDGLACTTDHCDAQLGCVHTPQDSVCGDGESCQPPLGCAAPLEVLVPEGWFWMGCDASADPDCPIDGREQPHRQVWLSAFEIDRVPVTTYHYAQCMQAGACEPTTSMWPLTANCRLGNPAWQNFAINCVTWFHARDYCEWAGKRLCTEAEWEKAARGTDGRLFPWGNEPPTCELATMANTNCSPTSAGLPVGSAPLGASPYGVLDMSGGIRNWVADWYSTAYYQTAPSHDPSGPETGVYKAVRGMDWWVSPTWSLRSSYRYNYHHPSTGSRALGIRCCRSVEP